MSQQSTVSNKNSQQSTLEEEKRTPTEKGVGLGIFEILEIDMSTSIFIPKEEVPEFFNAKKEDLSAKEIERLKEKFNELKGGKGELKSFITKQEQEPEKQ